VTGDFTLEEAIRHAVDVADSEGCSSCGLEHQQLAVWLMELHNLREIFDGAQLTTEKEPVRKDAMSKYNYQTVEGLDEINRYAGDGWRVVSASFKMGVWTALMELKTQ